MTRDRHAEKDAGSPADVTAEELKALKEKAAKADEHWEKVLRLGAEFENTKKRLERQSQEGIRFANEKLVLEVLPLVDDMDRAIASLDAGHELRKVKEGLHLVQNKFHRVLEQHGVEPIEAVGRPFDPHLHEAVAEVESDAEEGSVVEEVQRGYTLNGRLARPSRVKIARKRIAKEDA
jgi:molecular chaperone GrpE